MVELYYQYLFCCQYTTNSKILDLLEDLATKKQKCPTTNKNYGTNYHKLFNDVLKHFKLKNTSENEEKKNIKSWSSIRKKYIKDLILQNYIIEVKHKYNFSKHTTSNFQRDLKIGLNFKNINDKNIVIENNKISQILGLNLTNDNYTWDYDILLFS